jgi:hypothetical protein
MLQGNRNLEVLHTVSHRDSTYHMAQQLAVIQGRPKLASDGAIILVMTEPGCEVL